MSQRTFRVEMNDGRTLSVLTGYDRPLHYHFLVIRGGDDTLWSNLDHRDHPTGPDMSAEQVLYVLRERVGVVPPELPALLASDRDLQAGNVGSDLGTFQQG